MAEMSYAEAIRDGLATALRLDPSVICYGLGVTDPKGVFGTTLGLEAEFGSDRVFDMPTAENAMTGIAIGAALGGLRPVLTHQRLDFALLSMDQIVNNAAKWRFMFGGSASAPLVIRMILGRGWGQGPTHSQNLHAWFAHIPGLKVVMPTRPADAKGLLLSAIFGQDPVIFLEQRWLHNARGETPQGDYRVPIGPSAQLHSGDDLTVVSSGYLSIEALHAAQFLAANGVGCDLIDLRSLRPLDLPAIRASLVRTGRLLVLDSGFATGGIAGEILAWASETAFSALKVAPARLTAPDAPEATSPALTEAYHVRAEHIAARAAQMLGVTLDVEPLVSRRRFAHDTPGDWFKGPF